MLRPAKEPIPFPPWLLLSNGKLQRFLIQTPRLRSRQVFDFVHICIGVIFQDIIHIHTDRNLNLTFIPDAPVVKRHPCPTPGTDSSRRNITVIADIITGCHLCLSRSQCLTAYIHTLTSLQRMIAGPHILQILGRSKEGRIFKICRLAAVYFGSHHVDPVLAVCTSNGKCGTAWNRHHVSHRQINPLSGSLHAVSNRPRDFLFKSNGLCRQIYDLVGSHGHDPVLLLFRLSRQKRLLPNRLYIRIPLCFGHAAILPIYCNGHCKHKKDSQNFSPPAFYFHTNISFSHVLTGAGSHRMLSGYIHSTPPPVKTAVKTTGFCDIFSSFSALILCRPEQSDK